MPIQCEAVKTFSLANGFKVDIFGDPITHRPAEPGLHHNDDLLYTWARSMGTQQPQLDGRFKVKIYSAANIGRCTSRPTLNPVFVLDLVTESSGDATFWKHDEVERFVKLKNFTYCLICLLDGEGGDDEGDDEGEE